MGVWESRVVVGGGVRVGLGGAPWRLDALCDGAALVAVALRGVGEEGGGLVFGAALRGVWGSACWGEEWVRRMGKVEPGPSGLVLGYGGCVSFMGRVIAGAGCVLLEGCVVPLEGCVLLLEGRLVCCRPRFARVIVAGMGDHGA